MEEILLTQHPSWVQEFAKKRAIEQFGRCVAIHTYDTLASILVFKETPEGHDVWMEAQCGEYDRLFDAWIKNR